jgi:predicted nucleic acid-binding protein
MALTHLLDTSVLTRLSNPRIREIVQPKAEHSELARAGIGDLEIGYSARNAGEWDRLMKAVEVFDLVQTSGQHMRRARQVQRLLAAKHQRGRKIPDLLIAAAAEAADLTVLHYDADFDLIGAVTGQPCEWIVPAGEID